VPRGRDERREGKAGGVGELRSTGSEAARLVVDYVKQETLDPIKGLGRYLLFGVAGSVALAIGLVILAVAFLRLLQGETGGTFDGNWSWAPYLICTVVVVAVAALAVAVVVRGYGRTSGGEGRQG
jgi:putative superfamily III holin-X